MLQYLVYILLHFTQKQNAAGFWFWILEAEIANLLQFQGPETDTIQLFLDLLVFSQPILYDAYLLRQCCVLESLDHFPWYATSPEPSPLTWKEHPDKCAPQGQVIVSAN